MQPVAETVRALAGARGGTAGCRAGRAARRRRRRARRASLAGGREARLRGLERESGAVAFGVGARVSKIGKINKIQNFANFWRAHSRLYQNETNKRPYLIISRPTANRFVSPVGLLRALAAVLLSPYESGYDPSCALK